MTYRQLKNVGQTLAFTASRGLWDEAYMLEEAKTALQLTLAEAIERSDKTRDQLDAQLQRKLLTKGKPLWDIQRGKIKRPGPPTLRAIEEVFGFAPDALLQLVYPSERHHAPDQPLTRSADAGETVEIIKLDLSLPMGPGATVEDYIEQEPLKFDLAYIRGFTRTPAHRLRIAAGVGDSMFPTLNSADLVWIDSTQTMLNQTDKIWAVSINGGAAIKRLRPLRDGRVLIISDNSVIDNYEVDADEILIGGRVIRFSRDV